MVCMKALSLFSGIGGIDLAAYVAGIDVVAMCERDQFCQGVLRRNFPEAQIYDDVSILKGSDVGSVDLIFGGFPCQDVSFSGRKAGLKGARSGLWSHFHRLIGEIRPAWVLIENVRGLVNDGLLQVVSDLAGMGYDAEWCLVSACEAGAPHTRQRVFIVSYPQGDRWEGRRQARANAAPMEPAGLGAKHLRAWAIEPRPVPVAYGVSRGMDSRRAYGNAVVPAQVYRILRAIKEAHDEIAEPQKFTDVRAYLAEMGKRGGRARSTAKKKSSPLNAKRGGRPRAGERCARCGVDWGNHKPCRGKQ
jgi:DNA (cytosine-5)-methyltransferase 1